MEKEENSSENSQIEKDELKERKEKFFNFLNKKRELVFYGLLVFIAFVGIYVRTRNISKLKDVTTGTWTLGPDLDPFLFLRWAKDIIANGFLTAHDAMRYVPLGYDTAGEMKLLAYMIAYFHKILSFLSISDSITYSAILFPAVIFFLTSFAFFLFAREIFFKEETKTKNIIALISTAFFVLIPSLLPRTIAGIPEKESAAFLFMFLAFYFFLKAFNTDKFKKSLLFSALAGVSTGLMALVWGGFIFVFMTIPPSMLVSFLLFKIKEKEFAIYFTWIFCSFAIMMPFSTRYTLGNLVRSLSTGLSVVIFLIIGMSILLIKYGKLNKIQKKVNVSEELISVALSSIIILILIIIFFGSGVILGEIGDIKSNLIEPSTTRFGFTVAENKQPYFLSDWKYNFGPVSFNIPLYFWLFFIGSVALFAHLIRGMKKKEKIILVFSYFIFLISLIFSRYSQNSALNGLSNLSLMIYFGGWIFFIGCLGYYYFKKCKEGEYHIFREFNFSYIIYFVVLTLSIIGARGGIRLIMVLGAVSPVAVAFLVVKASKKYLTEKEETAKFFFGLIALILILSSVFTIWTYYKEDKSMGENFAPNVYTQQWQKAMAWVRENTSPNAVFAHWWDYGYWVQSIGERATILDGGNAIVYWNHLMGRYVLTGTDERTALEFLYTHNGTHLLIDSTDIGKYTAFSSIGADENYDRFSWISSFSMDESQVRETQNETSYLYVGGSMVDEDLIWNADGKEIFLPKRSAAIGGLIITESKGEIKQPEGIFIYNGNQYRIPLRYVYFNNELRDFKSGLDAGIFLYPSLKVSSDGKTTLNNKGAALYLSKRTVHSQLAQLYLFNQKSDYFKLAHTEDSYIVEMIKQQQDIGNFVEYQGFQGPIKIWEINYPKDIKANPEFLKTAFPNEDINLAKPGEYN